jgi:transposase InsO family protein
MEGLYFDPAVPGSLGGKERFYKHHPKYRGKQPDPFSAWEAYTLHKPTPKHKYPRNRTVVYSLDDQWQADLCDVSRLASKNKGTKFLLTVIDVFSRYAWVRPLKNKSGPAVAEAFEDIFQEDRVPARVQTDQGKEFLNHNVKAVFDERDVEHFFTHSPDVKAAFVERFNRTFKNRLYRYMTRENTDSYLPVLQDLVRSYNQTVHSAIDRTPESVKETDVKEVWKHQYGDLLEDTPAKRRKQLSKFQVGDTVRITKNKVPFNKGYLANWSDEVFKINQVIYRRPVVYKLKDLEGEDIKGVFYAPELQSVSGYEGDVLQSEVLRSKVNKKTGEREVLIHYKGYPKDSLKWIAEKDLE